LLGRSQIDADVDEHRVPPAGERIHWSDTRSVHVHGGGVADKV
jgi:hypothetical protein